MAAGHGQPSSSGTSEPDGALTGAEVEFEVDLTANTVLDSAFTPAQGEEISLDEARMLEIATRLFEKAQELSDKVGAK